MKLESFLLIAILGVASVFAADFIKEEASIKVSKLDEEFVLVDPDVKDANKLTKSYFYPKLDAPKDINAEMDRIKDNFENGKMTEATTIDLLVLMYQSFVDQMDSVELMQTSFNEIFQLTIEFPDIAYSSFKARPANKEVHFVKLRDRLIEDVSSLDAGIYDAVESKYRRMVYHDFSEKMVQEKTFKNVKEIFDSVDNLPEGSPLKFLKEVPSNLNLRNYLRFFMSVYAMSLQCKYIITKDNYSMSSLHMLFYDSARIFLRAFPEESGSSELATSLSFVLEDCREVIVGEVGDSRTAACHIIEEGMKFGLYETVALVLTLEVSSKIYDKNMFELLLFSLNILQFKIFSKLYQTWSAKFSLEDKREILKKTVTKIGASNYINENVAENFLIEDWEILIKSAADANNLSSVKALLRAGMLDNSVLSSLDLDFYKIFQAYLWDPRGYPLEDHAIEFLLLIPNINLDAKCRSGMSRSLREKLTDKYVSNLKDKLEMLISEARNRNYARFNDLFVTLVDRIGHYHFRKLMSHLNPNDCPELVQMVLAELGSKSGYIEEAAYGALEASNVDLLGLLVDSYSFKISETFAKRWAIKCQIDLNKGKLLEFQARFGDFNSFY